MKKSLAIVLALLTICVFPLSASAHHGRRISQGVCGGIQNAFHHGTSCRPCSHADTDGDWICDHCGSSFGGGWSCSHVDADGDGICDSCNTGWHCAHADADGDGICDSCDRVWSAGSGNGNGNGVGNGISNGTGTASGSGNGNGGRGGHHGGGGHGGRHHR